MNSRTSQLPPRGWRNKEGEENLRNLLVNSLTYPSNQLVILWLTLIIHWLTHVICWFTLNKTNASKQKTTKLNSNNLFFYCLNRICIINLKFTSWATIVFGFENPRASLSLSSLYDLSHAFCRANSRVRRRTSRTRGLYRLTKRK